MNEKKLKDEIGRKYYDEGKSLNDLSTEYGISNITLSKWMTDYLVMHISFQDYLKYRDFSGQQLRYKLVKLYREKRKNERYILINHYNSIDILESIILSQQSNDFYNCFVKINDSNLIDIFYEYEREKNTFIRVYVLCNLPVPSSLERDKLKDETSMKPEIIEVLNLKNYPFPEMFESDIVSLIYKRIDMISIKKGYVDIYFLEDIVNKLIPTNIPHSSQNKFLKEKEQFYEKVLASIYYLMNLSIVEYAENNRGKKIFLKNKNLRSKLLFRDIEWINENEKIMRIYLSRYICEDWAMENYKNMVFNESVELNK